MEEAIENAGVSHPALPKIITDYFAAVETQ
jgi:hypothetical protein